MKKVVFVDDEVSVLNGLKRMLRPLRDDWQMSFVESGAEALEILSQEPFNVIVSDMRMPGMNGADLLARVRNLYPSMIRIILSGYSNQDMLLKAVRPAHQFLSKPCDAETLKRTVQRASALQDLLTSKEVKQVVSQVDQLPSLPHLYTQIISKLDDEDINIKEIAKIIEQDVSMTAQILKLVNSSFFGFFKNINDTTHAVSLLGLDTLKTLVLSIEIFSTIKSGPNLTFLIEDLWRHSQITALFAKKIASLVSNDKVFIEEAFMAGFLHDIGILLLSSKLYDQYAQVLKRAEVEKMTIWDSELNFFETTHAEIGAYLLGLWGFNDGIIETVARHHKVLVHGDEPQSLIMVVHLADAFARHLDTDPAKIKMAKLDTEYLAELELMDQSKIWLDECTNLYQSGVI